MPTPTAAAMPTITPTRRRRWGALHTTLAAFVGAVLAFALALYLHRAEAGTPGQAPPAEDNALSEYERGRLAGRDELLHTVRAAYVQGQSDAIAASAGSASGVQLAQSCMAWWYHAPVDKGSLKKRVCGGGK